MYSPPRFYHTMLTHVLYHISTLSLPIHEATEFSDPFQSKLQVASLPPKYFNVHFINGIFILFTATFFFRYAQ